MTTRRIVAGWPQRVRDRPGMAGRTHVDTLERSLTSLAWPQMFPNFQFRVPSMRMHHPGRVSSCSAELNDGRGGADNPLRSSAWLQPPRHQPLR